MPSVVLCCSCPGIPQRAEAAAKVLRGGACPTMYIGDGIRGANLPESIAQYAKALLKSQEKFAYLFEYDMDGRAVFKYNLLTGREVK